MKYLVLLLCTWFLFSCSHEKSSSGMVKWNELTLAEKNIIEHKGTELAHSGEYNKHYEEGVYLCKRCDTALFESSAKFDSKTGWPSFDDAIRDAVAEKSDFTRTEIVCNTCDGHLGHVFKGEGMTPKSTRHCVNSLSLKFLPEKNVNKAIFASGCFWGTDYWLRQSPGVISTLTGYTGGQVESPDYRDVCTGTTGHYEAVEVSYDSEKVSYEDLAKLYFETHNPEQANGQGNDVGSQYLPAIFYLDESQKVTANKLLAELKAKGLQPATELKPAVKFWPAEDYHQDYYRKNGKKPYCHFYNPMFKDGAKLGIE